MVKDFSNEVEVPEIFGSRFQLSFFFFYIKCEIFVLVMLVVVLFIYDIKYIMSLF